MASIETTPNKESEAIFLAKFTGSLFQGFFICMIIYWVRNRKETSRIVERYKLVCIKNIISCSNLISR